MEIDFNFFPEIPHKTNYEQTLSNNFELSVMKCEAPIDLSRRCDSVETRETPSPYHSLAFDGENSPSLLNSPNTFMRSVSSASNFGGQLTDNNRADTPNQYLQSTAYVQQNFSTKFPYESDHSPSPKEESMPLHHPNQPHLRDHQISMLCSDEDELKRFLHAFTLQKLQTAIINDVLPFPMMQGSDDKVTRPFKAYSSNPLAVTAGIPANDSLLYHDSNERFNLYREEIKKKICEANGGRLTRTNPKMRRTSHRGKGESTDVINERCTDEGKLTPQQQQHQRQHNQDLASSLDQPNGIQADSNASNHSSCSGKESIKDDAYYERRRKNNAAAKKSRDQRRIKEDEIAIRAAFLERENLELKFELAAVKRQLAAFFEK